MVWTVALYVAAGLLFLLSLPIAFWLYLVLSSVRASTSWSQVEGVVTDSRIVSNRACNGLPGHHYFVAYEYTVGTEECRSSEVRFGNFRYMSKRAAQRTIDRYVKGQPVTVYFAADYPDAAVLEPGWSWECLYPVGLLASVFLCGIGLLVVAIMRSL